MFCSSSRRLSNQKLEAQAHPPDPQLKPKPPRKLMTPCLRGEGEIRENRLRKLQISDSIACGLGLFLKGVRGGLCVGETYRSLVGDAGGRGQSDVKDGDSGTLRVFRKVCPQ